MVQEEQEVARVVRQRAGSAHVRGSAKAFGSRTHVVVPARAGKHLSGEDERELLTDSPGDQYKRSS